MSNNIMGNLFVIAAPSGAGKTSLVKALTAVVSQLQISISHTTRSMRPGEVDGQDYFFVDEQTFSDMVAEGSFLEHATVYNHCYGTSKAWVESHLAAGVDVILEIDWQGARQIHQKFPQAILIFILPPSLESLAVRLKKRDQDDLETIENRMKLAQNEISHANEFHYLVVNDQFDLALSQLKEIVLASRLAIHIQIHRQAVLLANLLKKR